MYVHYIGLSSWFSLLLRRYSKHLLGGFDIDRDGPTAKILLSSFWNNFRYQHGDHVVYREHSGPLISLKDVLGLFKKQYRALVSPRVFSFHGTM